MGRQLRAHHLVHLGVGGEHVVLERRGRDIGCRLRAHGQLVALTDARHQLCQPRRHQTHMRRDMDPPHRRGKGGGLHGQTLHTGA